MAQAPSGEHANTVAGGSATSIAHPAPPPAPPSGPGPATVVDGAGAGVTGRTVEAAGDAARSGRQRLVGLALEVATALTVIAVFVASCRPIHVNPLTRVGQVSGMAKVDLRFVLMGLVIVAATLLAERFGGGSHRRYARQMACAAVAALSTSLVAGGLVMALHGTPYGILAGGSDFVRIAQWIDDFRNGGSIPAHYPPFPVYLVAAAVKISGQPVSIVTKPLEIAGTALFGPVAYFSWRTLLKPVWALTIGVVAMVPFIEPFKVYPHLVLVAFVPVMIKFFAVVRRSDQLTRRGAAGWGALFGTGFALLFLSYSGWFVWAVPGAVASFALLAPWRTAAGRALLLAGTALVVFVPLTWVHLTGLLAPTGGLSDDFQYFDTRADPAYIAMWRNDSGAGITQWPPLGELGNVGLFSVLLAAGFALALALGWRRTPVIVACATMAGAWLLRFYLAGDMYRTGQVKLYPRTTMIIMYLLLVLVGLAIFYATGRIQELFRRLPATPGQDGRATGADAPGRFGQRVPTAVMLAPLLMVFLFTGSATLDRLMPADRPGSDNMPIWISHTTNLPDGRCPAFAPGAYCVEHR